jgi:transcriptional regulator with XRE-family HTH domain
MSDPWAKSRVLLRQALKQLRLDAGLTQAEVAEKLEKPQSYVSKLESGDRSLDLIEAREFCLACGVGFERFVRRLEKVLVNSRA